MEKNITLRWMHSHEGIDYYADENGWAYFKRNGGPVECVKTCPPTFFGKMKILYMKKFKKYVVIGNL